jgi:3-deoxy-D-manno-octulosonic-acid transferase
MRWFFYNLFFAIGYTAMLPHFLLRMRRRGGYRARWRDRFGGACMRRMRRSASGSTP